MNPPGNMLDEFGSEQAALAKANAVLADLPAEARIAWAMRTLPGHPVSGIQQGPGSNSRPG